MAQILHKFNPLLHVAKSSLTSRSAGSGFYRHFTTLNNGLYR
jgi:cytochrome c oxidase assembly protein subunit 11